MVIRKILEAIHEKEFTVKPEFLEAPEGPSFHEVWPALLDAGWQMGSYTGGQLKLYHPNISTEMTSLILQYELPPTGAEVLGQAIITKAEKITKQKGADYVVQTIIPNTADQIVKKAHELLAEYGKPPEEYPEESPSASMSAPEDYNRVKNKLEDHGWHLNLGTDEGYALDGDMYANTEDEGGVYWEKWRHDDYPQYYIELTWEEDSPITVRWMLSHIHAPTGWVKTDPTDVWLEEMLNMFYLAEDM